MCCVSVSVSGIIVISFREMRMASIRYEKIEKEIDVWTEDEVENCGANGIGS